MDTPNDGIGDDEFGRVFEIGMTARKNKLPRLGYEKYKNEERQMAFRDGWDSQDAEEALEQKDNKNINLNDLAHEIWAAAQLLPQEGIEDGVKRIVKIIKENRNESKE